MLLAAGRATLQVGAQAGHGGVRVGAGDFELDVAVELLEALVAADLSANPDAARCLRSFWRASWSVL